MKHNNFQNMFYSKKVIVLQSHNYIQSLPRVAQKFSKHKGRKKPHTPLPIRDFSSNKSKPQGMAHISLREEGQSWSPKDMPFPLPPMVAWGGHCLLDAKSPCSPSGQEGVGSLLEHSQSRWFKQPKVQMLWTRAGSSFLQFLSFIRPSVKRSQRFYFCVFRRLLSCPWELIYKVTLCAGSCFHWYVLLSLIVGCSTVGLRCKTHFSSKEGEKSENT